MRKLVLSLLLVISCALGGPTWAQEMTSSVPPGSEERKAILRALRVPVQKELKKQALFKVDHLKVQNQWAFMRGVPACPLVLGQRGDTLDLRLGRVRQRHHRRSRREELRFRLPHQTHKDFPLAPTLPPKAAHDLGQCELELLGLLLQG